MCSIGGHYYSWHSCMGGNHSEFRITWEIKLMVIAVMIGRLLKEKMPLIYLMLWKKQLMISQKAKRLFNKKIMQLQERGY